ncbi:MAG: 50S ribosomal protein L1 [Candidatus Caldatribacterium sp.]|uniref:50S ribosomal protein L1 n=1 Tax=Candidatus Caldatribacterium sp. TaxID=2282143 RepID=UPI002997DCD4|nr:50S ribosomal protein L1 [Candidatus Caldatribacterium sp.]MCX7729863.1 50S ribosomal protein L1 [Candidatus Caldatribacterium sp.]MDW8082054.1 50S ribosomal protein L1 [Candidatus Calescibacterium sp.]
MAERSKRYLALKSKIEPGKLYEPEAAVRLLKEMASARFDETVEMVLNLGIDPRQSDQQVRGTVVLPHGTGKKVRVLVFAQGEKAREAQEAGADYVGGEELVERIQKGWFEFDAAVATPDMMRIVSRLGKILGPRGLMPNAKTGTVTFDIAQAVREIKSGRVEIRNDKFGNVHLAIGKASFTENQILDNFYAALDAVVRLKPPAAKGRYIKKVVLSLTMSPGVPVDVNTALVRMEKRAA